MTWSAEQRPRGNAHGWAPRQTSRGRRDFVDVTKTTALRQGDALGFPGVGHCHPPERERRAGQRARRGEMEAEAGVCWGVGQGPWAPPEPQEAVSRPSPARVRSADPRGALSHPELEDNNLCGVAPPRLYAASGNQDVNTETCRAAQSRDGRPRLPSPPRVSPPTGEDRAGVSWDGTAEVCGS